MGGRGGRTPPTLLPTSLPPLDPLFYWLLPLSQYKQSVGRRHDNLIKAKRKGARNEHKSRRLLEAAGYSVTRAAASLGLFDLIAIGAAGVLLVQVKSNSWPGRTEMERLRSFLTPPGCRKEVHRWRDWARLPDVREV